jgi:hypothetical protein
MFFKVVIREEPDIPNAPRLLVFLILLTAVIGQQRRGRACVRTGMLAPTRAHNDAAGQRARCA